MEDMKDTKDTNNDEKIDATESVVRTNAEYIANELKSHYYGRTYKCPDCDNTFDIKSNNREVRINEDGKEDENGTETKYIIKCPVCKKEHEFDDIDDLNDIESIYTACDLYDYLGSEELGVDYIVDSNLEYKSAIIMVGCGGPTEYIDTSIGAVDVYYGGHNAKHYLPSEVIDAINEIYEEDYNTILWSKCRGK